MDLPAKPLIKQGWLRALLYMAVVFAAMFVLDMLGRIVVSKMKGASVKPQQDLESIILIYSMAAAGVFAVTWLFRRMVDRESLKSLGFEWRGFTHDAWMGFFSGTLILGAGSLILLIPGYLVLTAFEWQTYPLLLELGLMVIVAFTEELLFRGYLLHNLLQSLNRWAALAISALLFVLVHNTNPDINLAALINIFAAGILLGINYIYTRNLWFSIFFHFSWNFFQGPILGYEVSGLPLQSLFKQSLAGPDILTGGPFGFEASVLCLVLTLLLTALLAFVFSKRAAPVS